MKETGRKNAERGKQAIGAETELTSRAGAMAAEELFRENREDNYLIIHHKSRNTACFMLLNTDTVWLVFWKIYYS